LRRSRRRPGPGAHIPRTSLHASTVSRSRSRALLFALAADKRPGLEDGKAPSVHSPEGHGDGLQVLSRAVTIYPRAQRRGWSTTQDCRSLTARAGFLSELRRWPRSLCNLRVVPWNRAKQRRTMNCRMARGSRENLHFGFGRQRRSRHRPRVTPCGGPRGAVSRLSVPASRRPQR
jgi:hypothetical protein